MSDAHTHAHDDGPETPGLGSEAASQLFRRLADTVPVLMWAADPWGGCLFLNDAWSAYTGVPVEEHLGDGWLEAVHPEDRAGVERAWVEALARGERFATHYRLRRNDGAYRWQQDHGLPYHAADGSVAGWVGGCVDVHEREGELERASFLAEAGIALDAVFDDETAAMQGLAELCARDLCEWARVDVLDEDGVRPLALAHDDVGRADRAAERHLLPEAVVRAARDGPVLLTGEEAAALVPGEDVSQAVVVPLVARGRALGLLSLASRTDRHFFDEDVVAFAGEVGRRAGLSLDNARLYREARRRQRETDEARVSLDALVESAPIGVGLLGTDLRYVRVNRALAEIDGVPAEDHVGRRLPEVLPEMDEAIEDRMREVLESGRPLVDLEVVGATPAEPGRRRHFLASLYRIALPGEDVLGIGATVVDITARREAESALRAQRDLYEALLRAQSEAGEAFVLMEEERVLYANEATERITARSVEELAALDSVLEIVADEERDEVRARLADVLAGGLLPAGFEIELLTPGGLRVAVEVAARGLDADGGRRVVVVARDVSERRRAEVERERLLAAERRARRESEAARARAAFLADISGILERSLRLDETLGEVAARLAGELCDIASIWVLDRDGQAVERYVSAARDPERDRVAKRLQGETVGLDVPANPVAEVMRTGRPLETRRLDAGFLRRTATSEDSYRRLARVGARSVLVLPLTARGRALGVLVTGWDRVSAWPEGADRELLDEVARRMGLIVDNAMLYAERAHIASTLQASLLPPALPRIPGLDLAARYLPAGEASEVGGDFYDVFPCRDGWAVVVGDVCGKGTEAAAVTAMARYTIRASTADEGSDAPGAHAFGVLNRTMVGEEIADRFLTAVMACLGTGRDGVVSAELAVAGHPAPIVVRADGTAEALDASGALIGVDLEARWGETGLRLAPGDALVLYTDGVTEADRRNPLDAVELAPLLAGELGGGPPPDASALADALRRIAERRAGGPLRDDVAVVALRVTGT